jgi:hypothetical protein
MSNCGACDAGIPHNCTYRPARYSDVVGPEEAAKFVEDERAAARRAEARRMDKPHTARREWRCGVMCDREVSGRHAKNCGYVDINGEPEESDCQNDPPCDWRKGVHSMSCAAKRNAVYTAKELKSAQADAWDNCARQYKLWEDTYPPTKEPENPYRSNDESL